MHAIIAKDLSKQYRIGEKQHGAMLRDVIVNAVTHPFRKRAEMPSVWALRGVSFTVNESELVGIVGRNGAGKTTLLKVLANITYPTAGELTVHGRVASLVEVGTGFHNELTGRENVFLNGSILGLRKKEIEENFDAIVDFAGVEKFIDTPIKRYSTGMRLRLGFAVAAHLSSDILLVDEVLAVGDMEFQRRCLTTLGRVRDNGRTVLFVSHNLEAIERLCPRTIWIDEGRIRADGETRDVIASYLATVSEAETNRVDLANETKRSGTGEVRYTRVEYLDRNKVPLSVIRSGGSLVLRLYYEGARDVHNPHFGVMISTDLGTLLAHINTWSDGFEIPLLSPGAGFVDLEIGSLNLMPGRYSVSLWR